MSTNEVSDDHFLIEVKLSMDIGTNYFTSYYSLLTSHYCPAHNPYFSIRLYNEARVSPSSSAALGILLLCS